MAMSALKTLALTVPLLVAVVDLPAQRAIQQLTNSVEVHQNAKISPDGLLVAFQGAGKLAVVPFIGGQETPVATSPNITSFLWANSSTGLYYVDAGVVRFVPRAGGSSQQIGTPPGTRQTLWDVNPGDTKLFGTRFDGATQRTHVFELASNGATAPRDLFNTQATISEIRLDPTGASLLYRETAPQPFQPVEYFGYNLLTRQSTSISGPIASGNPLDGQWLDSQTIVFWMLEPSSVRFQLMQASGQVVTPLTQGQFRHRYTSLSGDRKWVAMQGEYAGGITAAVMPTEGGGIVLLEPDGTSYSFSGGPSFDAAGRRVAFAASVGGATSQVYGVRLDRELYIRPRAELGQVFIVELPLQVSNEAGAVFMAAGLLPTPFPFGGFTYGFALDPTIMLQIGAQQAGQGNVVSNIPVPTDGTLIGASVFVQGIRLVNNQLQGDFTRYAEVQIF